MSDDNGTTTSESELKLQAMKSDLRLRQEIAKRLGQSFGGDRDLYEVLGYDVDLDAKDFYSMYTRGDIAQRIVGAYPQATWRNQPHVKDTAQDIGGEFSEKFQTLWKQHQLGHYLERADRLAGIGHYGILLLGFQDGKKLSEPVLQEGQEQVEAPLAYLSPYGEYNVDIERWEKDPQSPRFGLPREYTVETGSPLVGKTKSSQSIKVHHSRVLHIAEMLDEDEVYGIPRLMPVWNRLKDLQKVVGGSAEMFWLVANRGLAFIADAEADIDNIDDLKDQMDEYQHELRRTLTAQGGQFETLGSDTADPSGNTDTILDLISGTTGIPKRILLGNEAGELASSQDETNWNARIDERRESFAGPMIVRPFVRKMIQTGNLPEPEDEVKISWDPANELSASEQADVQKTRAEAIDRLSRAGIASRRTLIQIMNPEWTEDQIEEEISRLDSESPTMAP